jgi:hypothetical protein
MAGLSETLNKEQSKLTLEEIVKECSYETADEFALG